MNLKEGKLHSSFNHIHIPILLSNRAGETPVYPCGWYSVVDEDGNEKQLLVFDSQLKAYQDIEQNIKLLKGRLDVEGLLSIYFNECRQQPDVVELDYLLEYIEDTEAIPPFFTFEQRDALDPRQIAEKVNSLFSKEEDKEAWLKKLYDKAPILQQIYRYFYAFKKTVIDSTKVKHEAELETIDDRHEYEIVEDYYNLQELLDEVKKMFPLLNTEGLVRISWSNSVVRAWFALCQGLSIDGKGQYQIHVNKLLSSPYINREVIKYLIFHELLHGNGYWDHNEEFRKREWQYPNSAELDGILDSLILEYDMDEQYKNSVHYEVPVFDKGEEMKIDEDHVEEPIEDQTGYNPKVKGMHEGFKYCRNCGNKLPVKSKFCDKCGEKLDY